MKIAEAANILGIEGDITPEVAKTAYRAACKKFHPDVNPAGEEMMKIVNGAYDVLKDFAGKVELKEDEQAPDPTYPDAVNEALNAVFGLDGLEIEICGIWVWVGGNTFPHKDVLKASGFMFAGKKKRWYFRPAEWKSASRGKLSMDEIRFKFGSSRPANRQKGQHYQIEEAEARS
jgi:hypothetical protein